MTKMQREIAAKNDVVMDGRDIGTAVLPDAQVKIYMDADVSIRARRRVGELKLKGVEADVSVIEKEIAERDYRDSHREIAPLKRHEDAHYLDTGNMTAKQAAAKIREIIEKL
jgi:cytidylate kinase